RAARWTWSLAGPSRRPGCFAAECADRGRTPRVSRDVLVSSRLTNRTATPRRSRSRTENTEISHEGTKRRARGRPTATARERNRTRRSLHELDDQIEIGLRRPRVLPQIRHGRFAVRRLPDLAPSDVARDGVDFREAEKVLVPPALVRFLA